MSKIHPILPSSSSSSKSEPESFTIWMKSLVMQTNGCTVYNQHGQIVYRVDNYDSKGSSEVFLMDLYGNVLFTIKKLWLLNEWKGYRSDEQEKSKAQKPYFEVRKSSGILKGKLCCKVVVRSDNQCYKLEASEGKSAFKISDCNGEIVAKATRKQTTKGVVLGDDVLSMQIEKEVDKSFIMAIVTVYGLMIHRI